MKKIFFMCTCLIVLLSLILVSCDDSEDPEGACVTNSICSNDNPSKSCDDGTWHEGEKCEDIGYTRPCGSDNTVFCRPN